MNDNKKAKITSKIKTTKAIIAAAAIMTIVTSAAVVL
jgi:hypothetical protein